MYEQIAKKQNEIVNFNERRRYERRGRRQLEVQVPVSEILKCIQ